MPAYFSIIFEIKKENLYDELYKDFIKILEREGFVFKSGFWGFEDTPLEDIIAWNSSKLKEDFEIGYYEHFSNDYKQICWDYCSFSEVRHFIMNNKGSDTFTFEIIIPEDDFIQFHRGKVTYDQNITDALIQLVRNIWEWEYIEDIQTMLELSDMPPSYEKLLAGAMPSVEPFAIIPKTLYNNKMGEDYNISAIGRNGLLLKL